MDPCVCGHSVEEHGPRRGAPNATSCTECGCIAYEADPCEDDRDNEGGE